MSLHWFRVNFFRVPPVVYPLYIRCIQVSKPNQPPNQSRFKAVRERPWIERVPGVKRYSLASSRLLSRFQCGILSCNRLTASDEGKSSKKVCKKFGKGIKFALSLHPLKRNEGGETGGWRVHAVAAFWRCWRRSFPAGPFKRGREKKKFEKTSEKIWREW